MRQAGGSRTGGVAVGREQNSMPLMALQMSSSALFRSV